MESRIPALEDRVKRTQLKSTVDGVINRLNFETIGGFVKPGDVVLELFQQEMILLLKERLTQKI